MTFITRFSRLNSSAWSRLVLPTGLLLWCGLFFASCQSDSTLGLGVIKQDVTQIVETDTFAIDAHTVWQDSVRTDRGMSSYLLTGRYNDPHFGKISAQSFFKIIPTQDPVKLPDATDASLLATNVDSVVMVLSLRGLGQTLATDNIYPDHDNTETFYLHQLTDSIQDSRSYYGFETTPFDSDPVAKVEVSMRDLRENKVVRLNLTTSPYLKGQNLSNALLDVFRQGTMSRADFKNTFKGFALVSGTNNKNIVGFANDLPTALAVHYTRVFKQNDGVPNKNTPMVYNVLVGWHYHQISADRTGTKLAGMTAWQAVSSKLTDNKTFAQHLLGIHTRLSFPTLANLKKLGNVVINKALLVMKTEANTAVSYAPPRYIFFQEGLTNGRISLTTSGYPISIPLEFGSTSTGGTIDYASYNGRDEQYEAPVTRYAQYMMSGDKQNPYVFVTPANSLYGASASRTVERCVFGHSGANPANKVRLRVFYTIFK